MSARREKTFRSPRIWADVALLVVVLPVGIAALAFLLAIVLVPLSLISGIELGDRQLIPFCLVLAAVIVMFWARTKVVWSFTLHPDSVRIGSLWPRRVRYEAIRFIKAGRDFTTSDDPRGLTPVSIALGWLVEYRVLLRDADAERCFNALHAHCANAAAIDVDDTVFLARNKNASAFSYSNARIVRTLALRAAAAAGLAFLDLAVSRGELQALSGSPSAWLALLIFLFVVFAGYAVRNALLIRRVIASGRSPAVGAEQ
jgi:hypothetical protein